MQRVRILRRVETSDQITVTAETRAEAEAIAKEIAEQPHVQGCNVVAHAGTVAILDHVAKYLVPRGGTAEYDVPPEVAKGLIELGHAEPVSGTAPQD